MSTYASKGESGGFIENNREVLFVVGLLVGITIFAFGFGFFIISATTDTTPPAPYFTTTVDRVLLLVLSGIALIGGGAIIRRSMRIAGW